MEGDEAKDGGDAMKIGSSRVAIDQLDRYFAKKEYDKALEAIKHQLLKNPNQLNLKLRQAEILDLQGKRKEAIFIYRQIAETQARDGFYARAIAAYKKILRLDPEQNVHSELARLIEEDRRTKMSTQERRELPGILDENDRTTSQELKELKASALFASFERDALIEIITSTELRSYNEGDIIVTEGEAGSSLFLVVGGAVKVFTRTEDGGNVPLAELGPGDFFGEVSLLTGRPRTATITASTEVTAIELDRMNVDRIAEGHPEVRKVLEDFYERRAADTVEAVIKRIRENGTPDQEATSNSNGTGTPTSEA
jgi:cAMP-dependent protein kinase regulator